MASDSKVKTFKNFLKSLVEKEKAGGVKDKPGKNSGKKDACYHKVKSRYDVWPSAYASGALVKCRKVGAENWGTKTEGTLHHWFNDSKSKDGKAGWVQADGSPCANEEGEKSTPKCFSSKRLAALKRKGKKGKKLIDSAVRRKREQDSNQQDKKDGAKPTNVKTFAKGKKDPDYVKAEPGLNEAKKLYKYEYKRPGTDIEHLDIPCVNCNRKGARDTDHLMEPEHMKRRKEEHLALHQKGSRTPIQSKRYRRLSHLLVRDQMHQNNQIAKGGKAIREVQTLSKLKQLLVEGVKLITEEEFDSFKKLATSLYKKRKQYNDARKKGESGLQGLGAEIDDLKQKVMAHPINRVEFWRKNPKLLSKLEKVSSKYK